MHTESSHQDNREPQNSVASSGTTDRRAMLAGIGGLAAGALLAGKAHAGPLTPPPGPIAPTPGPEPRIPVNADNTPGTSTALFRISQPGSYYLTGNITGVAGKHGIEIAASGVTLDLNGFDLAGISGMGFRDGVRTAFFGLSGIAVLNGSVRNWGGNGIDLPGSNMRADGLRTDGNVLTGIRLGNASMITNCSACANGSGGVRVESGSTISNSIAFNNAGNGISASTGSSVIDSLAYENAGDGFSIGSGCTVASCTALGNVVDGINVFNGCTVMHCSARVNSSDGIRASSTCLIRDNNCSTNGSDGDGANIHVTGVDNRIEGNNCVGADRGIDVDGTGNIIIRNTCSGNGINYTIAANNRYGPIINVPATGTVAVNGNLASGTLTTADPHANFSY